MVAAAANDSRYSISVGINLSHRLRLIPIFNLRRSSISVLHPDFQIRRDFLVAISVLITKERDALELSSCRNVEHVGRIDDLRLRVFVVELQRSVVGSCSAVADNSLAYHFLSGNSDCCSSFNLNTAVDNQFGSKLAILARSELEFNTCIFTRSDSRESLLGDQVLTDIEFCSANTFLDVFLTERSDVERNSRSMVDSCCFRNLHIAKLSLVVRSVEV